MARADFVVVGAGPAGIRACETLVEAGISPILIDEGSRGGGQIYRRQPEQFRRSYADLYGSEARKARKVHDTLERISDRIVYRPDTLVWNIRDSKLHVHDGEKASSIAYDAVIIASGATDRIFPVPGWTLPGVYSLGASQIALKAQASAIGAQPLFMGAGPLLYLVAWQYLKAGGKPVAVLDTSGFGDRLAGLSRMLTRPLVLMQGLRYIAALRWAGVRIETGIAPIAFEGDEKVAAVRYRIKSGAVATIACDSVGFGYHLRAETQLADLAGAPFSYDAVLKQWLPDADLDGRTPVRGIYLAGDGIQLAGADGAEAMGRLAAYAALADAGYPVDPHRVGYERRTNRRMRRFRDGLAMAFPWPGRSLALDLPDEAIVCRCEVITAGALREVATGKGGAPEVNRAKALSRVGMGRCQGRFCGLASAEIVSATLDIPIADAGRLRGQAPVKPLPANLGIEP